VVDRWSLTITAASTRDRLARPRRRPVSARLSLPINLLIRYSGWACRDALIKRLRTLGTTSDGLRTPANHLHCIGLYVSLCQSLSSEACRCASPAVCQSRICHSKQSSVAVETPFCLSSRSRDGWLWVQFPRGADWSTRPGDSRTTLVRCRGWVYKW